MYPNIKAELARKGFGLQELADLLDLSIGSISKRMNGKVKWTTEEVDSIISMTGREYEYLFKKREV